MTTDKINYNEKKKQAMLAVIHQLDLKDNNHGIKDVVVVLANFWNRGVCLADKKARSDTTKQIFEKLYENPELLEKLADLEHDRWSRWEKYRSTKYTEMSSEWIRKRNLSYSKLTEKEKESDRKEARKTLELIKKYIKVD